MDTELWRPIPDFEVYEINPAGEVRRGDTKWRIKPYKTGRVALYNGRRQIRLRLCDLVAAVFPDGETRSVEQVPSAELDRLRRRIAALEGELRQLRQQSTQAPSAEAATLGHELAELRSENAELRATLAVYGAEL